MATTTTHYGFTKPGVNDYVDISVLNANFDNLDTVIYNNQLSAQAALDDIAPEYDATATYSVGDYVTYNKTLYKCATAITTAEAFDDTKWTAVKVGGELKSHDARISDLEAGVELEGAATNSFDDGIDSFFKKVESTIVPIQAGSGTPSPSNVRPIGGFTECIVTDADDETEPTQMNTAAISFGSDVGSNTVEFNQLYRIAIATTTTDRGCTIITNTDGTIEVSGTPDSSGNVLGTGVANVQNHIYFICGNSSDYDSVAFSSQSFGIDSSGGAIIKNTSANATWYYTLRITEGAVGQQISATLKPIVIDLTQMFGSTTADSIYNLEQSTPGAGVAWFKALYPRNYYPYNTGETLSVVYSGYIDLVSGKLIFTYGSADLGSLNWGYDSNRPGHFYTNSLASTIKGQGEGVCSHLEHKNVGANSTENYKISFVPSYGTGYLFAIDTDYSDPAAFKTAMSGAQLVYELATPQEYQLTPAQLRSLVGSNRLTSSTGEVTEVEYIKNKTIAWLLDLIRA